MCVRELQWIGRLPWRVASEHLEEERADAVEITACVGTIGAGKQLGRPTSRIGRDGGENHAAVAW